MVTFRTLAGTGHNVVKGGGRASADLADCLVAAQAAAERFVGGPVPRWRPAASWASWAAAAAAATAVAALLLAWVWGVPAAPEPPPAAAVAVVAGAPRPSVTPITAPAAIEPPAGLLAGAGIGCGRTGCLLAPAPIVQPVPGQSGAASPAWPADSDAWALDPQSIGAPSARAPATRQPLHNTPVAPDEADPTPADESPPEGEQGGAQAE